MNLWFYMDCDYMKINSIMIEAFFKLQNFVGSLCP